VSAQIVELRVEITPTPFDFIDYAPMHRFPDRGHAYRRVGRTSGGQSSRQWLRINLELIDNRCAARGGSSIPQVNSNV